MTDIKNLNKYFDHTLLKAEATSDDIIMLCEEAKEYDFYSVCVNSCYVPLAVEELEGTDVKVATVVGFPLGAMNADAKAYEADWSCEVGAAEVDVVINIGALKEGNFEYILDEISTIVMMVQDYDAIVKVIVETCMLTDEEIVKVCELAMKAGAAFMKTSTGFGGGGATEHHVALMSETVKTRLKVKASGSIRDLETTLKMIEAGADRIGSSASVQIMEEFKRKKANL